MPTRLNRPHVRLLIGAFALPCVVLIALGIRVISDERELAAAKLANEPLRVVAQIAAELTTRLERIARDEAARLSGYRTPEDLPAPGAGDASIVGWIRDGALRLPWDDDQSVAEAGESLRRAPYAEVIADGEGLENTGERFPAAAAAYARARTFARTPFETDYADLLRARALLKDPCECAADARQAYDKLLSSEAVDDQGMPLALYAATALVNMQAAHDRVLDLIDRRLSRRTRRQPVAAFRERDTLAALVKEAPKESQRRRARTLLPRLERELADMDQAIALQRDFPALMLAGSQGRVWRLYGSRPWLVSEGPALPGLAPFALAVPAAPLFAALDRDAALSAAGYGPLQFVTAGSTGLVVGDRFPGLRVSFPAADETAVMSRAARKQTFDILALVTVLAVTVFGGFALTRGVRRELEVADMRSQFVASVSHELRTPLTSIRMFAETLQMDRPLAPAARAEYLDTIVTESERLTRLIDNVLDFSAIERDQRRYRLERAPLAPVVRQAAGTMQYPLEQQGFELRVATHDDDVQVRMDADAIRQALLNLLGNAMKYSRDNRRIDLMLSGVNGHAVVEVRDYGLGIAPADQTRIFERFYRAPVPENSRVPGAGLGLSIVDHIVKGHGGFMTVTSVPGEGSTFAIHLPIEARS